MEQTLLFSAIMTLASGCCGSFYTLTSSRIPILAILLQMLSLEQALLAMLLAKLC